MYMYVEMITCLFVSVRVIATALQAAAIDRAHMQRKERASITIGRLPNFRIIADNSNAKYVTVTLLTVCMHVCMCVCVFICLLLCCCYSFSYPIYHKVQQKK